MPPDEPSANDVVLPGQPSLSVQPGLGRALESTAIDLSSHRRWEFRGTSRGCTLIWQPDGDPPQQGSGRVIRVIVHSGWSSARVLEVCSGAALALHPFVAIAEPAKFRNLRWTVYYPRAANDRFALTTEALTRTLRGTMSTIWAYVNSGKNLRHALSDPQAMSRNPKDY